MDQPLRHAAAFLLSSLAGAFCSVVIIILSWNEPIASGSQSFYFVALFWGTLLSLPYVGAGLAVFGLPVTWCLHRHIANPWFGLLAAAWGGVAGQITHYLFNAGRSGEDELGWLAGIQYVGALYGVTTGVAWWLIYRRLLADRPDEA